MINKVQERALRLSYKDNENNFPTLLNENKETSAHQRNLQFLMTEIYKIKNNTLHPLCIICSSFVKTLYNDESWEELLHVIRKLQIMD